MLLGMVVATASLGGIPLDGAASDWKHSGILSHEIPESDFHQYCNELSISGKCEDRHHYLVAKSRGHYITMFRENNRHYLSVFARP